MTNEQKIQAKLWRDVFVAYVSASNSSRFDAAATWADRAVSEYKLRFKHKPNKTPDNGKE